ncbi:MAG: endolytic transglycosylase MltG [Elusimicrobia bacterium]|jgi:UPF0755 protein|nr:endolytic transglycosylase MltG [Elusimicrobiota bacterium]
MKKRIVLLGVLLGIFGGGGPLLGILLWVNTPPPEAMGGLIEILPGASARVISRRLKEDGHVRSSRWIEMLARVTRADQKLKAGLYRIPAQERADRILRFLVQGRGATVRVTVPEGFAVWQIAERLESKGVCRAEEFRAVATPWEGFLFPDTYFFDPGSPVSEPLRVMQNRFNVVWQEVFLSAVQAGGVRFPDGQEAVVPEGPDGVMLSADGRRWTVRQIVTLASLIERETRRADERTRVSAVYHNRLKIRMRLECDPTVQYALGGWKNPLYKKDIEVDSPYNTYRRYGLPPGPIASPGRDSLTAAMAPAPVDFLFFVSDGEGGHRFSTSYGDHRRAVRAFRRFKKE